MLLHTQLLHNESSYQVRVHWAKLISYFTRFFRYVICKGILFGDLFTCHQSINKRPKLWGVIIWGKVAQFCKLAKLITEKMYLSVIFYYEFDR